MNRFRFLGLAAIAGFPIITLAGNEALVGVLEEPQCKDGGGTYVRALYVKTNGQWRPLNTASASAGYVPKRISWVVSLDGKKIGNIETDDLGFTTNYDWTYPRDRLLNVVPSNNNPSIPNRSKSFGGWCTAPKNRPLVVIANGSVADPDSWKPFVPSQEQVIQLFPQFKAHNGEAIVCPDPNAERGVRFKYGTKDVLPLKSYKSRKGQHLITLAFKPRKDTCDGPDDGWNTQTFLVDGKTTYVGANATLVDAGDYDADGTSDLLFWLSSYNKDGYILFSPGTGDRREYLWSYH